MTIRRTAAFFAFAFLASCIGICMAEEKAKEKDATFDLKEAPILKNANFAQSIWQAMSVQCSTEPFKEVKAYPKLHSKRPLYGKLQFNRTAPGKLEAPIYFVLDESGEKPPVDETPAVHEKKEKKADKTKATAKRRAAATPRKLSSYDRLVIDTNRDDDLTNDPVVKPMKNPPWNFIPNANYSYTQIDGVPPPTPTEWQAFDTASVDIDYGQGIGVKPFRLFSWFSTDDAQKNPTMRFAAGTARSGTVRIGTTEYNAFLTQRVLTGRFDCPSTSVQFLPKNPSAAGARYLVAGGHTLMQMHNIDDDFFTLLATPTGDKLTVQMYRGPFGVFRIGPGDSKTKDISFQGDFFGKNSNLTVGFARPGAKKMTECKLPVGEYVNYYLTVDYGKLRVAIGNNYFSPLKPGSAASRSIRIQEDKPVVLEFSNKPEVVFQSPAADARVKLGSDLRIATLLIDPKSNIMVRGLTDPKRMIKKTVKYRVGKEEKEYTYTTLFSYEPTVTITNSAGKNVAEGVMPFG